MKRILIKNYYEPVEAVEKLKTKGITGIITATNPNPFETLVVTEDTVDESKVREVLEVKITDLKKLVDHAKQMGWIS